MKEVSLHSSICLWPLWLLGKHRVQLLLVWRSFLSWMRAAMVAEGLADRHVWTVIRSLLPQTHVRKYDQRRMCSLGPFCHGVVVV